MIQFIGKYGTQGQQSFKENAAAMGLSPLTAKKELNIFTDLDDTADYFTDSKSVDILMDGFFVDTDWLKTKGKTEQLNWIQDGFIQYGKKALESVDGTFSLVAWDSSRKSLHMCRDDGGAKLIYYWPSNNSLCFSNNLKLLLQVCGKPPISVKSLHEYLRFLDISPPYTIYENVFLLDSDQIISMDDAGLKISDKVKPIVSTPDISENLNINRDNLKKIFTESIGSRIENSKHTGAFLSGGIDSSLVCAVAASVKKDITAVTVGFHDPRYDESPVSRKVTAHLGIKHEVLKFTAGQDMSTLIEFCGNVPSPFADPAIIPTFQCFKQISNTFDVILDGTGADTLIGVMPARHIHFILNYSRHIPKRLRLLLARTLSLNSKTAVKKGLFDFQDAWQTMIRWKGWSSDEIAALTGQACDLAHTMFYNIYHDNPDKNPYELYSMLMGALPDDRIHSCSSMFGPDISFPFFDRTIRTYVRKLPMKHRYTEGTSKILFRELLNEYVPQEIWNVPKKGFDFPFADLLRADNFELIRTYLSDQSLSQHGFFNKRILQPCIDQFIKGNPQVNFKIWGLVLFQAWYENFYKKI